MPNACFRCRASIQSGRTFCRSCRSAVSLGEVTPAVVSRWWLLVAATTVGLSVGVVLSALAALTSVTAVGAVGGTLVLASWILFLVGLALDAQALQRADADWAPSTWYLVALAFPAVFVLPIPLVGTYYLSRRRQHVGLSR